MSHPGLEEAVFVASESVDAAGKAIAKALWGTFQSPNVSDANGEPANVVDALAHIAKAIYRLAEVVESGRPAAAFREPENRGIARIPDELRAPKRRRAIP